LLTEKLLQVTRYQDLLEDQDEEDETEQGRLLVQTSAGWRTQMAKWIADAREAEIDEDEDEEEQDEAPAITRGIRSWKKRLLKDLFGGQSKRPIDRAVFDAEAALMEATANMEEDERPDDGEVEIDSDEEYHD
jgi:hypothetical protein